MKLAACAALLVASTAAADPAPPAEVTADQAVALYRARSPRLAARRAAIDVTAADLEDHVVRWPMLLPKRARLKKRPKD